MSIHYETTKREFVRIPTDIPVRYKFLSHTVPIDSEGIYEGMTCYLSGSGMLLVGKLPGFSWIPGLLMEEILLGVNQTIMMGLSMLVITALVGTRDLGQEVYIALTKADTGRGLVAGLCVAFIAMISDRLISAWSARKKRELGLA